MVEHLPDIVAHGAQICVNGILECKSGAASMAAARIENQAAAVLACRSWLDDQALLLIQDRTSLTKKTSVYRKEAEDLVLGKAFVGSISYNGDWGYDRSLCSLASSLQRSLYSQRHDVCSMRVAAVIAHGVRHEPHRAAFKEIANFMD